MATNLFGIWRTQELSLTDIVKIDNKLNSYNIRGFMTLKDISEVFNINIKVLYKSLNLNMNSILPTIKMKELKNFNKDLSELNHV